VAGGRLGAALLLWSGVFVCTGVAVYTTAYIIYAITRLIARREASALLELNKYAIICQQDGRQLQFEAANEQNSQVEFQHYCEMAKMLQENLELLWRGGDASVLVLIRKGLNLKGIESLMEAAERHYDVEINGPLGASPMNQTDKMGRIREAGLGGRCIALLCNQLVRQIAKVRADLGVGG